MRLRLFPYYGSKIRISKHYPAPFYNEIVEPFAGAAGYSCLYYRNQINLYEKNIKVFDTLKFLIDASEKDILSLPILGFNDSVDDFDIPDGAKYLIGFWCNHGCSKPAKRLSTWGKQKITSSPDTANYWGIARRKILSDVVKKIKHWQVFNSEYSDAFQKHKDATWFIDPPYQKMGYAYPNSRIDFVELGNDCKKLTGQVIVCENSGADWLPFRDMVEHAGIRKTKKKNIEAVWINKDNFGFNFFQNGGKK